jgi:hypothetical protein
MGLGPALGYRAVPLSELNPKLNAETAVIVMLETAEGVNAGEKLLRRAGVKMHHGLRRRAGPVQVSDVQTELSCSIDEPAFPSRPASPEPRRAT